MMQAGEQGSKALEVFGYIGSVHTLGTVGNVGILARDLYVCMYVCMFVGMYVNR